MCAEPASQKGFYADYRCRVHGEPHPEVKLEIVVTDDSRPWAKPWRQQPELVEIGDGKIFIIPVVDPIRIRTRRWRDRRSVDWIVRRIRVRSAVGVFPGRTSDSVVSCARLKILA